MKIRKWSALLLVLLMIASLFLSGCFGKKKKGDRYEDLYYTIDDGGVTINACEESATGKLSIPNKIEGKPVTYIRHNAFENCTALTEVVIPDSVTDIGQKAFLNCTALKAVTIGDGVPYVLESLFWGCTNLQKISIGAGVTEIFGGSSEDYYSSRTLDMWLFYENPALTHIEVDKNNAVYASQDGVLFNKKKTTLICYPESKKGAYTIPDGVTLIIYSAFSGCNEVTALTIPDSLLFEGYDVLMSDVHCNTQNDLSVIDRPGILSFTVSENHPQYTTVDGVLFDRDKEEILLFPRARTDAYTIPDHVTCIGISAFSGCDVTEVNFHQEVKTIRKNAFHNCDALTEVVIPDGLTSIGASSFYGCAKLTTVTIGDGKTVIGDKAFASCDALTIVTVGDGVQKFSFSMVSNCENLKTITLGAGVTEIVQDEMYYGDVAGLFETCSSLTTICVDEENAYYTTVDGVLFDKNMTTLLCCPPGRKGAYTIPDGVTIIGAAGFSGCAQLTDVTFSDVTVIREYAFVNCGLTSVTIPDTVTHLGEFAFSECKGLKTATVGSGLSQLKERSFLYCENLHTLYLDKNIQSIGEYAFAGCDKLTTVQYSGTVEESGKINVAAGNQTLSDSTWKCA